MDAPMMMPSPRFGSMPRPTSDFQSVKDGRYTGPLYLDIDLSIARSAAAGTSLVLNVSGNSIYFDQLPGSGIATVFFENDDRGMAPCTVFAGFKAKVPFTRLLIENTAQSVGTILRLIYGVDIDLDPGTGAGVSVLNPINVQDAIDSTCRHYYLGTAVPVGNNFIVAAVGGGTPPIQYRIRNIYLAANAGAGGTVTIGVVAYPFGAWPGTLASSSNTCFLGVLTNWNTTVEQLNLPLNRLTPAGWRLAAFYSASVAVGGAEFAIEYEDA